ncbi:MAG TPA: response regulator [Steroidobacteraceae bacterium]|nr:response regulator [Steroidobacteraceae bacterium]
MSNKTRVLNVRVVGFSAPERQMLNSIFLLSVAPARQIGYKLWNPESGVAPDMYLLDGDSESAVASWQATFASTSDRTLVVGAKNLDLGVASASRPLGLKVVGAMDRLAIALNNAARDAAGLDVSAPATRSAPAAGSSSPTPKQEQTLTRATTGMTSQQPALSASMNAMSPLSPAASSLKSATLASSTMSPHSQSMTASSAASGSMSATASTAASTTHAGTLSSAMPASMTAAAPAATVLPNVTLQPNVSPMLEKSFDKSLNEKPVTERTVDRILSDRPLVDKPVDKPAEKTLAEKPQEKTLPPAALNLQSSGVTPLSPSALSAAVAPSPRSNLRVVPNPNPLQAQTTPLAASLPTSARIADAPMQPASPPPTARIAEAPMQPPPLAPVVTVNVTPPAPVMPTSAAPTPRHEEHNFRVLAVDDSPLMRTFLQNKLAPYGIQPEFAASGEEALFKISKQHFDLIFLDVMLPGMDGYDVCKMIKKNKDNALMKVVMLTSKDKTFDKIRGTMAGCDGYLTKPVDELKLRAIIERHSVSQK